MRGQPFRLQEHLVPVAVSKAVDLVLDRGAIARTGSTNRPAEQRRAVQVGPDDVVAAFVGAGDRTEHLRVHPRPAQRGHQPQIRIGRLLIQLRPVNRAAIQTRRRAGLESGHRQRCIAQLLGQALGRSLTNPPTDDPLLASEQHSAQESAGAEHDRIAFQLGAIRQLQASHAPASHAQRRRFPADQGQVTLPLQQALDLGLEQRPVGLDARPLHRAALGAVEHAVMDRGRIRSAGDDPVERIDFADQMPLPQSANRRVAAHRANDIEVKTDQRGARTHARGNGRGFHAGVSAADHDDVE